MAIIHKKTWNPYFNLSKCGIKKFDVRKLDFHIKPGDMLVLDEARKNGKVTGHFVKFVVKRVYRFKPEECKRLWNADIPTGLQIVTWE